MNYYDRPELSHSKLKRIDRGYEYYKQEFESSPAMREGTVLHEAILEGMQFEEGNYKTFCKSLKNNEVPEGYLEKIDYYKKRVLKHPEAHRLKGQVETELYSTREGFDIKGKVDVIGDGFLTDFKTTRSISTWLKGNYIKQWTVLNFSYHTQLEWYKYLAKKNGIDIKEVFLFVLALEEGEVFCLNLTELLPDATEINQRRLDKLIEYQFNEENKTNNYLFNNEVVLSSLYV